MTSPDDNLVQSTNVSNSTSIDVKNNNQPNNYNRHVNSNNNNIHPPSLGTEIRLLMTSRDAGAVIGKGGSSIQKLRVDYPQTVIQVPDCPSPERLLVIHGDQNQSFDALRKIIPLLTDSSRLSSFNRRRNTADGNSPATENEVQSDSPSEIRLLVHQIYCGAIIGKGGQHVKELRQKYNLDIKVFSQCCPLSHERVISLRGKVESIIECIQNIFLLMTTSSHQPRGSPMLQYDPRNFDVYSIHEYGGFQPPGTVDHRIGYNQRTNYIPGGPRGFRMYPIQSLAPLVDMPYAAGPGLNPRYPSPAIMTSTRVTLPNELVGAIIGPRGTKIQHIRHITNANIIIDDQSIPTPTGSADRIITIEGTPDQISQAQLLLQQAVRQSGLWRP